MSIYNAKYLEFQRKRYEDMLLSATFSIINKVLNTKQFDTYSLKKLEELIFNNKIFNGKSPIKDSKLLISEVFNELTLNSDIQRFSNILKVMENIKDSKTSEKFTNEINESFENALENKDLDGIKKILIYLDFSEDQVENLVNQYKDAIGIEEDFSEIENNNDFNLN